MKRRSTRHKRKRNLTRKRFYKGGALLNCEGLGFTKQMREASFGSQYTKTSIVGIHEDGETYSMERLQQLTFLGMIDWWEVVGLHRRKEEQRKFDYSRDLLRMINDTKIEKGDTPESVKNAIDSFKAAPIIGMDDIHDQAKLEIGVRIFDTLDILGAFYHRFKIVAERYSYAIRNLNQGIKGFFGPLLLQGKYGFDPATSDITLYEGPESYTRFMDDPNFTEKTRDVFKKMAVFVASDIYSKDLPMEIAIDRAQCIMFAIVKKVALPKGFVMDDRITALASKPIIISQYHQLINGIGTIKLQATFHWLDYIEYLYIKLNDPPVTFGVF